MGGDRGQGDKVESGGRSDLIGSHSFTGNLTSTLSEVDSIGVFGELGMIQLDLASSLKGLFIPSSVGCQSRTQTDSERCFLLGKTLLNLLGRNRIKPSKSKQTAVSPSYFKTKSRTLTNDSQKHL